VWFDIVAWKAPDLSIKGRSVARKR